MYVTDTYTTVAEPENSTLNSATACYLKREWLEHIWLYIWHLTLNFSVSENLRNDDADDNGDEDDGGGGGGGVGGDNDTINNRWDDILPCASEYQLRSLFRNDR